MQFKQPNKRIYLCWSIYTLIIAVISLGIGLFLTQLSVLPVSLAYILAVVWVMALVLILAVYFPLRYRRMRYAVSEDTLVVVRGLLLTIHRQMPLSAIRYITALRGPLERLTGLTSLFISASGGYLFIEGLTADEASALTLELL